MSPMKWYGNEAIKHTQDIECARVRIATIALTRYIRKKVSRTQRLQRARDAGGKFLKGSFWYGMDPSTPGEYPKMVSKTFRKSIKYEYSRKLMTGRVGTNLKYGKYLELGTKNMKRRPWLSRGMWEFRKRIKRILEKGR